MSIVLYGIVLYCIVLYCIVLYCIVLYCIVLYCIVLYCIVLYCIVLYCIECGTQAEYELYSNIQRRITISCKIDEQNQLEANTGSHLSHGRIHCGCEK